MYGPREEYRIGYRMDNKGPRQACWIPCKDGDSIYAAIVKRLGGYPVQILSISRRCRSYNRKGGNCNKLTSGTYCHHHADRYRHEDA